jgi:quercetin dioxygenase-like cupin family protein
MPFLNLHDVEEKELIPGFKARFIHSENMTFAYWEVEAGGVLPEHSHAHEQITAVLEGEVEFTINGETKVLKPGLVAVIPSNAVHTGKMIKRCRIIDVFHPVREDYR